MAYPKKNLSPISVRFLFQHPAHFIALGFGSGLSRIAPGTAGTLFAWGSFYFISQLFSATPYALILWLTTLTLSFFLGLWACQVTAKAMCSQDPGAIVWDEVVAFWLALFTVSLFTPSLSLEIQIATFLLFRLFDMVKKGPVHWADQQFANTKYDYRNAFGIMFDDIVAALLTIIVVCASYFLYIQFSYA